MIGDIPEQLIEHPNPQQVKLAGKFFIRRHEIAIKMHVNVVPLLDLEHLHVLNILKVSIDRHV